MCIRDRYHRLPYRSSHARRVNLNKKIFLCQDLQTPNIASARQLHWPHYHQSLSPEKLSCPLINENKYQKLSPPVHPAQPPWELNSLFTLHSYTNFFYNLNIGFLFNKVKYLFLN